ncbi:hypothetical protein GCM10025771_25580 [Niveibacterium umoris]
MWKKIRITLLALILATVIVDTWRSQHKASEWRATLHVAVYPINADGSDAAARRIASLEQSSFEDIERFLGDEAQRYGITTSRPVKLTLQPPLSSAPPLAPKHASMLEAVAWSLKLRWWVWRLPPATPRPDIRLFVQYWQAKNGGIPASHGLERGHIAIAHVFADGAMQRANAVVIAHELLHTLGATDKYDFATLEPVYPEGYAEPDAQPRLPQRFCELMAGRIPRGDMPPEQPRGLDDCLVGAKTAREIGFIKPAS